MLNASVISSLENTLRNFGAIIVAYCDEAELNYQAALDLKQGDPQIAFPNLFDQDLDEIINENLQLQEVLNRALEHLDLAVIALEELH